MGHGTETIESNERNERNDEEKVNEEKEKPWKIVIQNMKGLITETSKEKEELLKEYTEVDNIILMNITETWCDDTVEDVVEIEGYNIYRGDRKEIIRGGTAIYLHDKLEANKICEISYQKCDMVAIMIPEIQTINIVIYRPPGTRSSEFNHILNELQRILRNLEKPDPTIILSGDFNFPFVKWKRMPDNNCSWEYKSHTNARIENTLDLVFTNEISLITSVEVNNSNHSDHNKVEISTNYITTEHERNNERNEETNVFKTLNFHAKSVNWNNIIRCIEDTNWEQKFETKDSIQNNE